LKTAGAGRQIGDDENGQDADGRDVDAAQEQCGSIEASVSGNRSVAAVNRTSFPLYTPLSAVGESDSKRSFAMPQQLSPQMSEVAWSANRPFDSLPDARNNRDERTRRGRW
jgi:hypothetical protein